MMNRRSFIKNIGAGLVTLSVFPIATIKELSSLSGSFLSKFKDSLPGPDISFTVSFPPPSHFDCRCMEVWSDKAAIAMKDHIDEMMFNHIRKGMR